MGDFSQTIHIALLCTMTPLQVYSHGNLVGCNLERQFVVGPAFGGRRVCGLDRSDVNRCLGEKFQSNCVAGVVARSEKLELEDERHGEVSAAGLAVSLLAAVLTSCPPAWGADLSLNSTNAMRMDMSMLTLNRGFVTEYAELRCWRMIQKLEN